jgi:hypothetical protein
MKRMEPQLSLLIVRNTVSCDKSANTHGLKVALSGWSDKQFGSRHELFLYFSKIWCRKEDLNLRPIAYEATALPTELFRRAGKNWNAIIADVHIKVSGYTLLILWEGPDYRRTATGMRTGDGISTAACTFTDDGAISRTCNNVGNKIRVRPWLPSQRCCCSKTTG